MDILATINRVNNQIDRGQIGCGNARVFAGSVLNGFELAKSIDGATSATSLSLGYLPSSRI